MIINFKQILAGVTQTGRDSVDILDVVRSRWYIVTAVASILCLLFVPFEKLVGDFAAHLHILLAMIPVATAAWCLALSGKKQSQKPLRNHVTIRYACGHSSKMDREQVAEWAGSNINVDQLDLHVSCRRCSAAMPAAEPAGKKKRISPRLVGSAVVGVVILAIVAYGFTSGIANSMINQATILSDSISSMQDFASSGGASDLLSGKGSIEDLTSLKGAVPGGDQLELAGIEAYSFADGYVAIGEARFALEVADTDEEKSRGLSFSEGLKADQAFLVQNPKSTTITLLSASFTVDALWLADSKVVDIAQGITECKVSSLDQVMQSSGSGCVYKPSDSADSILYLSGGTVASIGIAEGDMVYLTLS